MSNNGTSAIGRRIVCTLLLAGAVFATAVAPASACTEEIALEAAQATRVAAEEAKAARDASFAVREELGKVEDRARYRDIAAANAVVIQTEDWPQRATDAYERADRAYDVADVQYKKVRAASEKKPENAVIRKAHAEALEAIKDAAQARKGAEDDVQLAGLRWASMCCLVLHKFDDEYGFERSYRIAWNFTNIARRDAKEAEWAAKDIASTVWLVGQEVLKMERAETDHALEEPLSQVQWVLAGRGKTRLKEVLEASQRSRERIAIIRERLDRMEKRAGELRVISYLRERLAIEDARLATANSDAPKLVAELDAAVQAAIAKPQEIRDRKEAKRKEAEEATRLAAEQAEQAAEAARIRAEQEAELQRIRAEQLALAQLQRQATQGDLGPEQIQVDDRTPLLEQSSQQRPGCCASCNVL